MHVKSIIAAASGLVVATSALLLPPDLPVTEKDMMSTLPVPTNLDVDIQIANAPTTQSVALKCPGCVRRKDHGPKHPHIKELPAKGKPKHHKGKHNKEIPSHLNLDFNIESINGADRLTVNGFELYPNLDPNEQLSAPLVFDKPMGHIKGKPMNLLKPLGYGVHTGLVATNEDENLQLLSIELQIMQYDGVFNDGIPDVMVTLVKSQSGKLAMGNVNVIEKAGRPMGNQKECSTMLCKWKAILMQKLSALRSKGCGGRRPASAEKHDQEHGSAPQPPRWARILMRFSTRVLLPVLIGALAGVSAGLCVFPMCPNYLG